MSALTIKDLIAKMEALAEPDAEVFFVTAAGDVHTIEGGLLDTEEGGSRVGLLLVSEPVVTDGGF